VAKCFTLLGSGHEQARRTSACALHGLGRTSAIAIVHPDQTAVMRNVGADPEAADPPLDSTSRKRTLVHLCFYALQPAGD